MPHYLFVAGVNMETTILDTSDISTIRGAGLATLWAPHEIAHLLRAEFGQDRVRIVATGASEGLLRLADDIDPIAAELRLRQHLGVNRPSTIHPGADLAPFRHLRFVTGVASGPESAFARCRAEAVAQARRRQAEQATLPPFERPASSLGPCGRQKLLPANAMRSIRGQPAEPIADSLYDRHVFGRRLRQTFYRRELALGTDLPPADIDFLVNAMGFTDDFEEIVGTHTLATELRSSLPVSVRGKLGYIYMDGNRFGSRAQAAATRGEAAFASFSNTTETKRRQLLAALLRHLAVADAKDWRLGMQRWRDAEPELGEPADRLRFETLLWGGEEMCFVVPAWAVLEVAAFLQEQLADTQRWDLGDGGPPLTHGMGILVCQHKTPVRLARKLAAKLNDDAKDVDRDSNRLQVLVLESVDIPPEGALEMRSRLLGLAEEQAASNLTFHGSQLAALLGHVRRLKHGTTTARAVPRSQLYRFFREALALRRRGADEADWHLRFGRVLEDRYATMEELGDRSSVEWLLDLLPGADPLTKLWQLIELWDYVDPFGLQRPSGASTT